MRTWTKVETAIADHPKTWKLATRWQTHPYMVVGFFVAFWGYLLEYHPDGDVDAVPDDVLERYAAPCVARAIGVLGTVRETLRDVGWVDADGHWHDWDEYSGALLRKRAANRQRMKRQRDSGGTQTAHVSRTSRARTGSRDKSLESRVDAAAAATALELSPDGTDALTRLMRAAQSPDGLLAEVRMILAGERALNPKPTPDDVSLALQDLAMTGEKVTGARLRSFCEAAARKRLQPKTTAGSTTPFQDAMLGGAQ